MIINSKPVLKAVRTSDRVTRCIKRPRCKLSQFNSSRKCSSCFLQSFCRHYLLSYIYGNIHDTVNFTINISDRSIGKLKIVRFEYAVQEHPNGLAEAFIIGKEFVGNDKVALVLGDNIFYGAGFSKLVQSFNDVDGAAVFAYEVNDPERYGVVEFDENNNALSLEEKPKAPKSNFAVPGLYFYDNQVVEIAKNIPASPRGEYEITDVNKVYLDRKKLQVGIMNRGTAWLDTGTFESLADACEFVRVIEKRQSQKIGCIEEVAFRMGFIDKAQLLVLADKYAKSGYGEYLRNLKK